jgi:hypothetical protein
MRIRFPLQWRIQTTRNKIIFTSLATKSDTCFELLCIRSEYVEQTDADLREYMSSFSGESTEPKHITLGTFSGFEIIIPNREIRLYLRKRRFTIMGTIKPVIADKLFINEVFELISNIELKDAESGRRED